jgi:hypothetical protein
MNEMRFFYLFPLFFSPTSSLQLVSRGDGPPLFFSTGLFGTMPRFFYSSLCKKLEKNFTVFTGKDVNSLGEVADEIGVKKVALLTHSSFHPSFLGSGRVESAVLCDPVTFPSLDLTREERAPFLSPKEVDVEIPLLVLRTKSAYDTFIPSTFDPSFLGSSTVLTFETPGHASLLDDAYSSLADRLPTLGRKRQLTDFSKWKKDKSVRFSSRIENDLYRSEVATMISDFILGEKVHILP